MIAPTQADIGQEVLYATRGLPELGVLTSFNEQFAFVRYEGETGSKATPLDRLYWANRHLHVPASLDSAP